LNYTGLDEEETADTWSFADFTDKPSHFVQECTQIRHAKENGRNFRLASSMVRSDRSVTEDGKLYLNNMAAKWHFPAGALML
jgi:hypothetical protein